MNIENEKLVKTIKELVKLDDNSLSEKCLKDCDVKRCLFALYDLLKEKDCGDCINKGAEDNIHLPCYRCKRFSFLDDMYGYYDERCNREFYG